MWKDFASKFSAKKVIAVFSVIAIIVLAVIFVPLITDQEDIPVVNPGVEQSTDEPKENPGNTREENEKPEEGSEEHTSELQSPQ